MLKKLKRWLMQLIQEAIIIELVPRLYELRASIVEENELTQRKLDTILLRLSELSEKKDEPLPEPLHQTRPSWMRMKKLLEENDVRKGLESARNENLELQATRNREINNQAEVVAKYWENKQKGLGD